MGSRSSSRDVLFTTVLTSGSAIILGFPPAGLFLFPFGSSTFIYQFPTRARAWDERSHTRGGGADGSLISRWRCQKGQLQIKTAPPSSGSRLSHRGRWRAAGRASGRSDERERGARGSSILGAAATGGGSDCGTRADCPSSAPPPPPSYRSPGAGLERVVM